ncbi:MAG: nucleotide exchange factor GrpE, partial [PS1 clade bacterium]|nr:nucleotide exchange factor GrpE [PS1 clade bacterium]
MPQMQDDETELPETPATETPATETPATETEADANQETVSQMPKEAAEPTPEERLAEVNDQLLRTLAELENTRKRAERDRGEALKFGAMGFARDMLGVADNLQRALKAVAD